MYKNKKASIGFTDLLTILFIGLKLTGYIDWSWFWVLSPILIRIALIFFIGVFLGITEDSRIENKVKNSFQQKLNELQENYKNNIS